MLIDFYRHDLEQFDQLCQNYNCNKSTWTIDLLHLLRQSSIEAILHTLTVGCLSGYETVPYYQGMINQDRERVEQLFSKELAHVRVGSLSWTDLKRHLIDHARPCVVLVDANQLQCSTCQRSMFSRLVDRLIPNLATDYQGHYILLIGFTGDDDQQTIRYVDPSKTDAFCTTSQSNFDQARRAFGTDEDVICCF
jgi:hypothetical protein